MSAPSDTAHLAYRLACFDALFRVLLQPSPDTPDEKPTPRATAMPAGEGEDRASPPFHRF
jgi:hypothetical protein